MAPCPDRRIACVFLVPLLLCIALSPPAFAQQIAYEYDALGRLILVTSPEGVAQYEYDAVGNILRITTRRYADVSGPVTILAMSPTSGSPGTTVHLYGRGFAATLGDNQVAFNGTPAPVTAVTGGLLTTVVPTGATSGLVTLTTPLGTATSPDPFTVLFPFTVVPAQAEVAFRGGLGFQAMLGDVPTPDVLWRVNGVVGGNDQYGRITVGGVYTAPQTVPQAVTVEAVLTADPRRIATATVQVVAPSGLFAAPWVSVGPAPPPASASPLLAPNLSVTPPQQIVNPLVAPSLSVTPPPPIPVANPLVAATLSVTAVPVITGVAPAAGTRGTSVTVAVTGAGLAGATALTLLQAGSADPSITVSDLNSAPEGTSLTATLTIGANAPVGVRILRVTVSGATSTGLGTGRNTFSVQ